MTGQLSLEEKMDFLLKRVDYLEEEVVDLRDENRGLKSQVCQLTDRLAKYENPKNSKNSSKPPSSDFPKLPKTQSLRESSGKKPGGQIGHDGTTLRMVSDPDVIQTHCPSFCTCCGENLSTIPAIFIGKRQVIDIPPILPIVTEHQIFNKCCKCGQLNQASFPMGVNTPVSYGENVQALTAYLSVRQCVPFNRLAELLSNLFGLSVSTGGIDYILTKMKAKASVAYESIRQNVLRNKVIGADETGISINGKNHWVWTFQHKRATFIAVHKNRGFNAINEIMVKYSDHLFNFLLNKDIPPDNNGSERAIRNFKVKQKISGFFKSDAGANIYATIRSVIDTALKNDQNPFEIIRLIAQCKVATE